MTGIELIAKERQEQIEKHGRTVELDVINNGANQLIDASIHLLSTIKTVFDFDDQEDYTPIGWDEAIYRKMAAKPSIQTLAIVGALCAAEIDRRQAVES